MSDWVRHAVRLVVSAIILMIVGFIVPGFAVMNFIQALLAAIVITVIGYLIESTMGKNVSPYGRGVVGFLVSAIVIWVASFIVPGLQVNFFGALLAAFIIGIIDLFVPTTIR